MADHLMPALIAGFGGLVLAVALFVPFVAVSYRRRGGMTIGRTLTWVAFLVYSLAIWTYTLVPFPVPDEVRCTSAQLTPLRFVVDILDHDVSSVGALVRNPAVLQVALNVLLFVPLGFFLRLLWGRGVVVTALAGLGLSLFVELTQLTGVWGLYPCAYRLFDVDDLIANTLGAIVGGALSRLLPRRAWSPGAPDTTAPRAVTVGRRLVVMLCDLLTVSLVGLAAGVVVQGWQLYVRQIPFADIDPAASSLATWTAPFLLQGVVVLATGGTVGDHAVQLRYVPGTWPTMPARLLRFVGGIGGFQLLGLVPGLPLDILFALVSVVLVLGTRDRRGLPGVISAQRLADAAR